uniref:Uncharacterized protein n=2 Tax=Caenorhabditis japonica TaxID=281687 RepID=A0A8R1IQE1_CAEJA
MVSKMETRACSTQNRCPSIRLNQLARMTKGTHRCDQPALRIGYSIKITDMKRLGLGPTCGVLDPMENVRLVVTCDATKLKTNLKKLKFAPKGAERAQWSAIALPGVLGGRVEETNTPDGTVEQFRGEWFQGDGMVRRKNLPIEYNT